MTNEKLLDLLGDIDDTVLTKSIDAATPQKVVFKRKKTVKRLLLIAAILILASTSLVVVAQNPLKNTWVAKIMLNSGEQEVVLKDEVRLVHIKQDAPKQALENPLTLTQAEEMLGVDLLTSPLFYKQEVYYNPVVEYYEILPNGKRAGKSTDIEQVHLWYSPCRTFDDADADMKSISMSVIIITDLAKKEYIPYDSPDAAGGKLYLRTYNLASADTSAVLCYCEAEGSGDVAASGRSYDRITAELCYKDVYYQFIGNNITEAEMTQLLDSLR